MYKALVKRNATNVIYREAYVTDWLYSYYVTFRENQKYLNQ